MPTAAGPAHERQELSPQQVEDYLCRLLGESLLVERIQPLGEFSAEGSVKGYGYGTPLKIECRGSDGTRHFVLESVAPGPFGHQEKADRAQILLSAHENFNSLPLHARSFDVGVFRRDGSLMSLDDSGEFFLLMEFVPGTEYSRDFYRIRDQQKIQAEDRSRCDALCDYLVEIHGRGKEAPDLYLRRLRELLGHSECILGMTDSYLDQDSVFSPETLRKIEHGCLDWRWRLKEKSHRLCQVHGDFHPWNILFQSDGHFRVLDRSRGEWGEAADDLVALTINFVFFSLQATGRVEGPFLELHERFWKRYLNLTRDYEILECAAPFIAFRGLVIASLLWYPDSSRTLRKALRNLILNVLADNEFDPGKIQSYCEKS